MDKKNTIFDTLKDEIESEKLRLPIFDSVSLRIQIELTKKEPNLKTIRNLIQSDQALSCNLLKIVNSAGYCGLVEITSVQHAISRIGLTEISKLIATEISRRSFSSKDRQINVIMKKLWQHSIGCALLAGWLSNKFDFGVMQKEAFFGGLFHDIGKLLILKIISDKKLKNKSIKVPDESIYNLMDLLHEKQGYLLITHLGLPSLYSVIARDHHLKKIDEENYLLVLIRMANYICHEMGIGMIVVNLFDDILATPEARQLGLTRSDLDEAQKFIGESSALTE
ncbi:MAG: HDOD domain-containing protein [Desulfobulbus sp.]|jgi:HD-like signal output (HDOD) protein|uniref:HDOD domain-containing protein n=1 Tax=Desulfobulbus sp. TaxID=895 RepID=UPI002842E6B1|nr:HDOD domain-containing protein [Desulfobulbus sp.]MDR2551129.1 HDOD domain-containing protein [Desulfobulbus sp.]